MSRKPQIEDIYPLSPTQQGILFHALYAPGSGVYVDQLTFHLRGSEDFSPAVFKRAIQRILDRHPVLRTGFAWEGRDQPLQVVYRDVQPAIEERDWSALSAAEVDAELRLLLAEDRRREFELSRPPLFRFHLLRRKPSWYLVILTYQHILVDAWSLRRVIQELLALYRAFCAGQDLEIKVPRPYREYIAWLKKQDLAAAEAFWRRHLAGFAARTPLAIGRLDGAQDAGLKQRDRRTVLPPGLGAELRAFARRHQLTLNNLFQGAWALLLSRMSGERDVVFGVTVSGRPDALTGAAEMVGLFINTLPFRARILPADQVVPWLRTLQDQQFTLAGYEYSPLAEVQAWSQVPAGTSLFESILIFENMLGGFRVADMGSEMAGRPLLDAEVVRYEPKTNYPLSLMVDPSDLSVRALFPAEMFDDPSIVRLLGHLESLLRAFVEAPEGRLSDLPFLTAAECHHLLYEWNDTALPLPDDRCPHELFETQAAATPDAVAVVFAGRSLTYDQLNRRANRLAHRLRALGLGPEVPVGLYVERSLEMIVGLLGVLKAGGVHLPLDPSYPKERLSFMLADAEVPVLLTQEQLAARLPHYGGQVIRLDVDWESLAGESEENPPSRVRPLNLCYLIYTSGSTGRPKGVGMSQGTLANLIHWQNGLVPFAAGARTLQFTSFSFDVSFLEILSTLSTAGTLVLMHEETRRDFDALARLLAEERVERLFMPFTALQHLTAFLETRERPDLHLRQAISTGEALYVTEQVIRFFQLLPGCTLHNEYGPTETHFVSEHTLPMGDPARWPKLPPIGRPIPNSGIYLLDRELRPVPIGVTGELYASGAVLARGYLGRPQLTAERFIPNAFGEPGSRLYSTGDLARYLPDGVIEYLGRMDHQVKIRGFRVELGEVEVTLGKHPGLREVAVAARQDGSDKRLVAYVVPREEPAPSMTEMRTFLLEQLPEHMVPAVFMVLDRLPLGATGKVDRLRLPEPETARPELDEAYAAPRNLVEEELARLFAAVLRVERVGVHDNFFELGGHSLSGSRMIARIRRDFQIDLSLRTLFLHPVLEDLAREVEAAIRQEAAAEPPLVPVDRSSLPEGLPLSFTQQRLWVACQLDPERSAYNLPVVERIRGALDRPALAKALGEIVRRHESLRTSYITVAGDPRQVILPPRPWHLPVIDLRGLPADRSELLAGEIATREAAWPFDLERGPLLRTALVWLGDEDHVLIRIVHHIASDAWSLEIFTHELMILYRSFAAGEPSPLPELPVQYADYAVWQRQVLQGESLERRLGYWRRQLRGAPRSLELPGRNPAREPTSRGGNLFFTLPVDLARAVNELCRQERVTLFMALLAAFESLLVRYTGATDLVVGTDLANRKHVELEGLIGFFINVLPLRTTVAAGLTFRDLLQRVREAALGAYAHQDVPFDRVLADLRTDGAPHASGLFDVLFVMQNAPASPPGSAQVEIERFGFEYGFSRFDLALFLQEEGQTISGRWNYRTDLYATETVARYSRHFQTLLSSIIADPSARLDSLTYLQQNEVLGNMEKRTEERKKSFQTFRQAQPKAVQLGGSVVDVGTLPGQTFPIVVQPTRADVDLADWAAANRALIEEKLLRHGAVLFRGFAVLTAQAFETAARAICPELYGEYGDLPKEQTGEKLYQSTPYPPDKTILFHNESSHTPRWPLRQFFYCVKSASRGGETPIADCREILRRLQPEVRERFAQKGLRYVRNFINGVDVSWQAFFKTDDPMVVEEQCRQSGIGLAWRDGGKELRCWQLAPAIAQHPITGEAVFFNQIQLHHAACLDEDVRAPLELLFSRDEMPRNVCYGDGSPIEDSMIQDLQQLYWDCAVSFPWQEGDILAVDNMLVAHARNPFEGERKMMVAMGQMFERKALDLDDATSFGRRSES